MDLINRATHLTLRWIKSNGHQYRFKNAKDVEDLKKLIYVYLKPSDPVKFGKGAKLTNWDAVFTYVKAISAIVFLLFLVTPVHALTFTERYTFSTSGSYQFEPKAKISTLPKTTATKVNKAQTHESMVASAVNEIPEFKKFLTDEGASTRQIVLKHLSLYYQGEELTAADNILKKEAGYRYDALNELGAGGIPQALPHTKMGCPLTKEGIICQAQWFVGYINRRYGTPTQAWAFHQANNWY